MERSSSLLSAFALLAFASTIHFASCHHAEIVSLKELGGFVERVLVSPVHFLLSLDDFVKSFAPALFLNALRPLFFDLRKLLHLVFKVSLCLITLLVFLAHILIVLIERVRIFVLRLVEVLQ